MAKRITWWEAAETGYPRADMKAERVSGCWPAGMGEIFDACSEGDFDSSDLPSIIHHPFLEPVENKADKKSPSALAQEMPEFQVLHEDRKFKRVCPEDFLSC